MVATSTATPARLLRPVATAAEYQTLDKELRAFIDTNLREGHDFGVIDGGRKKSLWKPGAEKLMKLFGLVPEFLELAVEVDHDRRVSYDIESWEEQPKPVDESMVTEMVREGTGRFRNVAGDRDRGGKQWIWQERVEEEGTAVGLYRFVFKCQLKLGGTVVGEGLGSCSTMESEYIRNPRNTENTIVKMAKKRSSIDAVITTLALSDYFTQDEEMVTARATAAASSPPPATVKQAVGEALVQLGITAQKPPPPPIEDKISLIASIERHFKALGIEDVAEREAWMEKNLGGRPKNLEQMKRMHDELVKRTTPAEAQPQDAGAAAKVERDLLTEVFAFMDEIDNCTDGDQLDLMIKKARPKLDEIMQTAPGIAHGLEAYSLRTGAFFHNNKVELNDDEQNALDWLEERRGRGVKENDDG